MEVRFSKSVASDGVTGGSVKQGALGELFLQWAWQATEYPAGGDGGLVSDSGGQ